MSSGLFPQSNFALFVGLRYSFSRKRNRFTSVIAMVSMLGMVLGVASLITVLSVMNGFAGELRGRILSLVSHGYVVPVQGGLADWRELRERLLQSPEVLAVSPYISDKVILAGRGSLRGAVLTAIDPALEASVSRIGQSMVAGALEDLSTGSFQVVLGKTLASNLGVQPGDRIQVTVPHLTVTPLGVFPRSKRLTVSGVFEIGAQPDAYQAYVALTTGQKLLGQAQTVDGLQVKTRDLLAAPQIMAELARGLPPALSVTDWSQTQGTLFQAVRMEKVMVSLLLLCVVAVAAFNIVSTLVMSVAEKRRDIAVLRTMGARTHGIMAVFVAHGLGLAAAGVSLGLVLGVLLASYISPLTLIIESVLGVKLFDPAVYFISELPSRLLWTDVAGIAAASLLLSLLATLYPAWRATRVAPAEVLRYE